MKTKDLLVNMLSALCLAGIASSAIADTVYSGGTYRTYDVNKPSTCTTNCPVIIDMHGYTSSASAEKASSGILQVGNANGVVTVFPSGLNSSWNAGSGAYGSCCGLSQTYNVNDVGFIKAMIAKIKTAYPVDPKRIYVTGISNGCALSQRLAAEASDVIAGAACSSLYLLTGQTSLSRPISVTEIHGLQDSVVSYNKSTSWTGAQNNFKRWATLNQCTGTPVKTALTASSYVEKYSTCAGGVTVTQYSIKSDHITYQNTDGLNIAQITWDSLKDVRLP